MIELAYSLYCISGTLMLLQAINFSHQSQGNKLSILSFLCLFSWSFYREFLKIVLIDTDEEKSKFFLELISPIISSDKSALMITTLETLAHILYYQGSFQNFMFLKLLTLIQLISALTRIPDGFEEKIVFYIVEYLIIYLPFYLGNIQFELKKSLIKVIAVYSICYHICPKIEDNGLIAQGALEFLCEALKYFLIYFFLQANWYCLDELHQENRKLIIRKKYSKIQNNYLFYFYYGGSHTFKHLTHFLLLFIAPLIETLTLLCIFEKFSIPIKAFLIYGISLPLGYLIALANDENSRKNTILNSLTLSICIYLVIG